MPVDVYVIPSWHSMTIAAVLPAQPAGTPPGLPFRATTEMPGVSLLLMALFQSGGNNYKITH